MDAKLKTLPQRRQSDILDYARDHSLADTLKWVREQGVQTSGTALSAFLSWHRLREQLMANDSTVKSILECLKSSNPKFTAEQLQIAGQAFFSALAIEQQDAQAWMWTQQTSIKKEQLALERQKFQRETAELFIKWFEDKRAKDVLSGTTDNADKIEKLGELMFGEEWHK